MRTEYTRQNNIDLLIPPGETLQDKLDEIGMSQKELAQRIGMTAKTVNEIISGATPITAETANKLEKVLGISAVFWINLEGIYRIQKIKIDEQTTLDMDKARLHDYTICYSDLAKHGYVIKSQKESLRIESLRKFFGVTQLDLVLQLPQYAIFRQAYSKNIDEHSIAAWLRIGEIEAAQMNVASFNMSILKNHIKQIAQLTNLEVSAYSQTITRLCAEAGVKVVYSPYLKNTYANGAVRWLGQNPILQLNVRGAYADIFWFTLMHELGHIVLHGKKERFLELEDNIKSEMEKEADEFAQEAFIPTALYEQFKKLGDWTRLSILAFAKKVGVHPGIVAGRLARDKDINEFDYKQASIFRSKLQIA